MLLAVLSSIALGGCNSITGEVVTTPPPSPQLEINNLSPSEVNVMVSASSYPIHFIDVRTPEEFAGGHIDDAINIDFYSPDFENNIDQLDKNAFYIVYCRTGNRSAEASDIMLRHGFMHITNMTGGITDWIDAGLPVNK